MVTDEKGWKQLKFIVFYTFIMFFEKQPSFFFLLHYIYLTLSYFYIKTYIRIGYNAVLYC